MAGRLIELVQGRMDKFEGRISSLGDRLTDRVERFRENLEWKWFKIQCGFWIVVAIIVAYSPPARWLFGSKS